jgi:hypothetical protein
MPRTQTNDPALRHGPYIMRFGLKSFITTGSTLAGAPAPKVNWVITSMDIVHRSAESGAVCSICVNSASWTIFGAMTGAGSYDTFSWRGELAMNNVDVIKCGVVTGTWDFNCNGYVENDWVGFPSS